MAKVYAIRDRKAKVFHRPIFERDHVMAVRAFEDACRDTNSSLHKWPYDYELLFLGEFDEATGKFQMVDLPVVMAEPGQFVFAEPVKAAQ